jgi:dethiobiotin synthetase
MRPFFISGIGTGIGKTVVSAVLMEALQADYWKPVQAGFDKGTDSTWIASMVSNSKTTIHPETYKLELAASPHIAAAKENIHIDLNKILQDFNHLKSDRPLIIEGAGGLMVPLNEKEFVIDLIRQLDARLILVSRNYLGSINHSLMTAKLCRSCGLNPAGWIFNDHYLDYEHEIVAWSGYPALYSLPSMPTITPGSVSAAAGRVDLNYLYSLL